MRVEVFDNQIEAALKALKKHMLKDGLFQEMKRREHYEKPSVKRKRKQAQARKKRRRGAGRAGGRGPRGLPRVSAGGRGARVQLLLGEPSRRDGWTGGARGGGGGDTASGDRDWGDSAPHARTSEHRAGRARQCPFPGPSSPRGGKREPGGPQTCARGDRRAAIPVSGAPHRRRR